MNTVRHITHSIPRPPRDVYAFAKEPENLPAWASGLAAGIRKDGARWITDAPFGEVEVRLTPDNEQGILDHDVVMPDGTTVHNPLRVLPNGDGSEVVFSLFRLPGVTDEAFEKDARTVASDLARLEKVVVER